MLVLALDTATAAVTVAVSEGERTLAVSTTVDARRHSELLAPAIAAVLAEAGVTPRDLAAVAVGVGPGPFTGLRVGLVTARTTAAALGVPVIGVCTLDVLALDAGLDAEFVVATDARRREVYWARYDGAGSDAPRRVDGPHVNRPADVARPGPVVGEGAVLWPDAFPDARAPRHPSAAVLGRWVAQGRPTLDSQPLYLRRPDAVEPAARRAPSP